MKRTIIADGDATHVVTRTAVKYRARAQVRTEHGDSLLLTVERDGSWTLTYQAAGFGTHEPLASGQMGPQDCDLGHEAAGQYHTHECGA